MKTKFYTLMVVIMTSVGSAWGQWSGLGTEDNPFLITNEDDLKALATNVNNRTSSYTGKYFKLTDDITLTDAWIPIGIHASGQSAIKSFNGIFDGDDHTISGIKEVNDYEDIGLFGSVGDYNNSGVIKNLKVEGEISGINTGEDIGLLVAVLQNGTIDNCSSAGTITVNEEDRAGGLVGRNYGSISNSTSTCIINSYNNNNFSAGGLVGSNYGGTITDCKASGDVSANGSDYFIGGLVGSNLDNGSIINCSASGTVSSLNKSNYVGGLAGKNDDDGAIEGCFAYGNVSSEGIGCYVGGLVGGNLSIISESFASGNVSVTSGTLSYVGGLVGYNNGGTIKKSNSSGSVTTDNADTYRIGGLVGKNDKTTSLIENCFVSGTVTTFGNGSHIGGLVGSSQSNIDTSSAIGDVTASGSECHIGGLVGDQNDGKITNSFATGIVKANAEECRAGGLVGYSREKISYCYATGATFANAKSYIGGLVGYSISEINDSYATGNVTMIYTAGGRIGGLVGYGNDYCKIKNSYSTGIIPNGSGTSLYIGNFVGDISNSATITECYAKNTGNKDIGRGSGFTVTDIDDVSEGLMGTLRNILNGNFWGVSEDNYPYLNALRKHEVTYTNASNAPTMVNYGVGALQVSNITRTGYNALTLIDDWYDAATNGTKVTFPLLTVQDSVLFALWKANSYKINLNADGGFVSRNNISVDYDAEIGEIPDPTRNGFAFDGWYYNDTKYTATTIYKESTDITLQARWAQLKEASIVSQPQGGGDYCAGDNIILTVTASGTGLKYQWYKDGSAIKDATSEDYYITNAKNSHSGVYTVKVTANIGEPVMSNGVVIKVTDPPAIITDLDLYATFSATAILNIVATGDNLTYQWYHNGEEIPDAVSDNIQVREEGHYYVSVKGDCGQINSSICNVTFDYADIVINRKVTLLQTTGVVTSPNTGVYYVESRNDFVFEMWPQAGYSLDNVKVTTDKGFEVIIEPAESATAEAPRLRVSVKRINTTTTITIEGAVESNSSVGETHVADTKVWSYDGKANFNLAERAEVSIYTTTGLLYSKQTLPAGTSSIELPKGIYIIQIANENTTKVIIK
jgi:Listeria-Bacteroides repeat domain (List_Bact_rpt)./The GLUG motif.